MKGDATETYEDADCRRDDEDYPDDQWDDLRHEHFEGAFVLRVWRVRTIRVNPM